jgi:phospho-N-acetylmuramoyl-pentapeptide-transferase
MARRRSESAVLIWIVFGVAVGGLCAVVLLSILRRSPFRQHPYEDAPQTHQTKSGTPTMGGLVFLAALAASLPVARLPLLGPLVYLVVACGAIGFLDDYLAVRQKANRGLRARTKLLITALVAVIFLRTIDASTAFYPRDVVFAAGTHALSVPHWLWLLLGIVAITGTIHAVNLTDGLDGLATGSMIPPLLVIAIIASQITLPGVAVAAAVGLGACIAFLPFNRYPARMFMGDTGSLALGALLAGAAILCGEMLLLVVVGGVFVAEALSVILQVGYFKATGGKRIFRMSPLHHHYELGGWPETKVTTRFWLASIACSLVGWAVVR